MALLSYSLEAFVCDALASTEVEVRQLRAHGGKSVQWCVCDMHIPVQG